MCPVSCFTLHDMCHLQRAVSDSVCKRPMIAPDWCRPWGHLCPQLLGQMEQLIQLVKTVDVVLLLQASHGHDPGGHCPHWLAT